MSFAEALAGGDRRSTGRADEVAARVLADPGALSELFACLWGGDPAVRIRAGDAIEKVSALRPDLVTPHAGALLALGEAGAEQEMRWHLAQMLPRLGLGVAMRARAVALMRSYFNHASWIVRAFALTALAAFAEVDAKLRAEVGRLLGEAAASGMPSMRVRKLRRAQVWGLSHRALHRLAPTAIWAQVRNPGDAWPKGRAKAVGAARASCGCG